jgi:acyl transferase domain-containing protein/acyl carrier protein
LNPEDPSQAPLAIVGIGCLFPGAPGFGPFWSRILKGADSITDVPASHWRPEDYYHSDPKAPDHVYAARGGFLDPVPFNPAEYGIAPNDLEAIDTAQLLGLVVARMALEDAGYAAEPGAEEGERGLRPLNRGRVSVVLGVTGTLELVIPLGARLGHPLWRRALREAGVTEDVAEDVVRRIAAGYVGWQENSFPGLLGNVVAGRIANRFDLGGTNCVVDAACASSLGALHLAALELTSGRADVVLTGGVDAFNDVFMFTCFSKTPALSPTGDARPFDAAADGTVLGEGLGMVVLKRLADARRDGDRLYAIVRGIGTASDGRGNAVYAPKAAGQVAALRQAYRSAGVGPDTVELVEAHGTGTRLGDATEAAALAEVYQEARPEGTWCALGSIKSQIGHTKAAAGVAGLIKIAAALYHKVLPPTIKVTEPIEALQPGRSPFYVNAEPRPWMPSPDHPRRAAVSAFGFGGSNFHCVVEEAGAAKPGIHWDGDVQILAFGAGSPGELHSRVTAEPVPDEWEAFRRRAARSRRDWDPHSPCRLLLVAERGRTDLGRLLRSAAEWIERPSDAPRGKVPEGVFPGEGPAPKLAVLFPGQGAQYVGMLRDLACRFPSLQEELAAADRGFPPEERLSDRIYPFTAFTQQGRAAQEAALCSTRTAQPALMAVSLGAWRVLEDFGLRPDAAAGHSFGELAALCAAGRLTPAEAHALALLRGRLMAAPADEAGAMLAVQASPEAIAEVLAAEGLDLVLANKNAPEQNVLSGPVAHIERAEKAFTRRQVAGRRLNVSAAFHSPLVSAAREPFRTALERIPFAPGRMPVYANSTATPYPDDPTAARELLAGQLARPVEWVAEIEALYAAGVRTFLEVGPGRRLSALVSAILRGRDHAVLALDASKGQRSGMFDLACCLAGLAAHGHAVRLDAWDGGVCPPAPSAVGRPTLVVPLCGANYVKPKPALPARVPPSPKPPSTNASLAPTMNGSSPNHEPASLTPRPRMSPPAEAPGLSQALEVTRETLAALQKMQEQTAQLHRQFLEGQEAAQRTVQALVEQQQRLLQMSLGLSPVAPPTAPLPQPAPGPVGPQQGVDTHRSPVLSPVAGILVEIVSEKTGYPPEMLDLDMALDADLGIDSIKRVEILAALQERLPEAPAVKPEHLGTLHTLRHVADFLANGQQPSPEAKQPSPVAEVLLGVVSEKTGYPPEMLDLDMALDADLGIDSIKRVEILAALQERLPEAPAVKPEHLGTLHTLRHVVDFLAGGGLPPASRERQRPEAPVADAPGSPALERSILRSIPLDPLATREAVHLAAGAEVWLTNDDADLSLAIENHLRARGFMPRCVPCAALSRLEPPALLGGLVLLAPPAEVKDAFLADALRGLRRAASSLRAAGHQGGALLVAVSRLDGAFGLVEIDPDREPVDGGLAGLIKTAACEWPKVHCKALDLAGDLANVDANAAAVIEEMFLAGPVEVGLAPMGRCTLKQLVRPLSSTVPGRLFAADDVIVLSGGARGVTAEVAVKLARAFRPTLVLLGRTPEPGPEPDWLVPLGTEAEIKRELGLRANGNASLKVIGEQYRQVAAQREVCRTLARIEAAGGQAVYRAADVRDPAAVAEVLAGVRRNFGPIRGLVHGAGVLADARIEDKTDEQFRHVYATKVCGLRHLLGALDPEALKALVLFSSSTARFGRVGQVDYAIANEVLNKLAHRYAARLPRCRVVSVNWGPWDGGMVSGGLKQLFEREGVGLIPPDAGAAFLVQELRANDDAVEVVALASPPSPLSPVFGGETFGAHRPRSGGPGCRPAPASGPAGRLRAHPGARRVPGAGQPRPRRPAGLAHGADSGLAGSRRPAPQPRFGLPRLRRLPHPVRRHPRGRGPAHGARGSGQGGQAGRCVRRPRGAARPARRQGRAARPRQRPPGDRPSSRPCRAAPSAARPLPPPPGRGLRQPPLPRPAAARHRAGRGLRCRWHHRPAAVGASTLGVARPAAAAAVAGRSPGPRRRFPAPDPVEPEPARRRLPALSRRPLSAVPALVPSGGNTRRGPRHPGRRPQRPGRRRLPGPRQSAHRPPGGLRVRHRRRPRPRLRPPPRRDCPVLSSPVLWVLPDRKKENAGHAGRAAYRHRRHGRCLPRRAGSPATLGPRRRCRRRQPRRPGWPLASRSR